MTLRIGNKITAYSVGRRAYSKNKKNFYSCLSAIRYHFDFAQCPSPKCPEFVEGPLNARTGFTLVEVMAAAAVLSFGIVLVYGAFFTLLDSYEYYVTYLNVSTRIDEKLWDAQNSLTCLGTQAQVHTSGSFPAKGKQINWSVSAGVIDEAQDDILYKVDAAAGWKTGKRQVSLVRNAYALYKKNP